MASLLRQIALVRAASAHVKIGDFLTVSAAIQRQVTRDLAPIWEISATIDAFEKVSDVPVGYWPVIIVDKLPDPSLAGVHEDVNGQPLALVVAASKIEDWSVAASHEVLEMLVDPYGNRLVPGDSPKAGQGRVRFLVEICDPSEGAENGYSSNGVRVSDFYTPNFFDPFPSAGVRYSFSGNIKKPHEVLKGGYLTWQELAKGEWWQKTRFGEKPGFRPLQGIDQRATGNLRAAVDRQSIEHTQKAIANRPTRPKHEGKTEAVNDEASKFIAKALMKLDLGGGPKLGGWIPIGGH